MEIEFCDCGEYDGTPSDGDLVAEIRGNKPTGRKCNLMGGAKLNSSPDCDLGASIFRPVPTDGRFFLS